MFRVGDPVRLARGWTPLIVLKVYDNGTIIAKYAKDNPTYPVTEYDYRNPEQAYGVQRRHFNEFVHWDGQQVSKAHKIMAQRYRTNFAPFNVGTFLNKTSTGLYVLEMDGGNVNAFHPCDLTEDIPNTFKVKSTSSNYTCHYVVPKGATISVNDVLMSKSGNLYTVTETNTKMRNPKGVFQGFRVLQEAL
ncbi:hypothetical protein SUFG_00037 [Sulfitobacter phage phiCB2047-B]|uniref:Uncharacterized protein n=1 Tax=Sulfitobacter phage phiCB2047-B TaxID=754046 RepID=M4PYH5_9CAUD|nr:hypothetical protein SUFG_00037 [Sulfitobacter phage phiCB2047-B]AGH07404.1 hypothetical protein SUFG_00037 [Sulfitobacter phage phiCB2047-B]